MKEKSAQAMMEFDPLVLPDTGLQPSTIYAIIDMGPHLAFFKNQPVMNKKTGLYVVSNGVVCFTSTISWGGEMIRNKNIADVSDDIFSLRHEIEKVYTYWAEHGEGQPIKSIIISGRDAVVISQISNLSPNPNIQLQVAHVWQNAFSGEYYVPAISFDDSLDYDISAGLALP